MFALAYFQKLHLVTGLIFWACLWSAKAHADPLQQGNAAYKAGHYKAALQHFDEALAQGKRSPALLYNRAVTLYKLDQLEQAKNAFIHLLEFPKWAALAHYNLGRLAEQVNDKSQALKQYQKVLEITQNARLRKIATRKIAHLTKKQHTAKKKPTAKKGAALVSLGVVYDDNAASLAEELTNGSSNSEDTYIRTLAYGQYYVSGAKNDGVKIYGLAQTRHFETFESFNTQISGAGFNVESPWNQWTLDLGGRYLNIQVDSATLSNQWTGSAKLGRNWLAGEAEVEYQLSFFDAGDNYDHLEGWQQSVSFSWKKKLDSLTFKPAVVWQYNDRENKESSTIFYSYSPNVFTLKANMQSDLNQDWRLYSDISWSFAKYDGKNKLTDVNGENKEEQRENTALQIKLGARYKLHQHWLLKGEYTYKDSDDTFDLYSYDKNVMALKLEFLW